MFFYLGGFNSKHCMRLSFLVFCITFTTGFCQIPYGYYDAAEGQTGYTLKSTLHTIIDNHSARNYTALWTLYETSDIRSDGKVWDIYANCDFNFGKPEVGGDQDVGTGGSIECDKFNREHTFPRSWFGGDIEPMNSDPFHVVPTDKKVNSVRGSFPYGEVSSPSYTSSNGSKLGPNSIAGYTGTVFEPIDEFKGDIARGYFYMATRYETSIASWESLDGNGNAMLNGTSDQAFEDWALTMLIEWHESDPVSQKEIDRNEAIYDFQGNRNPFIDHPEYVACIWQNNCGTTTNPSIAVNESLSDFGSVVFGASSAVQSYTVEGAELTDNIIITSTNGFEISLTDSDGSFTNQLSLEPSNGVVSSTTVFVRLTPISNSNEVINGEIVHSSSGASSVTITVSGSEQVDGTPTISIDKSILEFEAVSFGEVSDIQSYMLSAVDLTDQVTISSASDFEISLTEDDNDFGSSINLDVTDGNISSTPIYVRFKPMSDSNDLVEGHVTHVSQGAETKTLSVSGTEKEIIIPEINFSFSETTLTENENLTVDLFANEVLSDQITTNISIENLVGLTADEFTTIPSANNSLALNWATDTQLNSLEILFGSGLFESPGDKSLDFVLQPATDGSYTVGSNNRYSINIRGAVVSSLDDELNEFTLYPNPSNGIFKIRAALQHFEFQVFNAQGRLIERGINKRSIDLSDQSRGLYSVVFIINSSTILQKIYLQ